jgi:hypothetical protein
LLLVLVLVRGDVVMKQSNLAVMVLGVLLVVFAACEQPGGTTNRNNPSAPASEDENETEQKNGIETEDETKTGNETEQAVPTGIAIRSLPAITIYARGMSFDKTGLVVVWTYDDGREEAIPEGGYSLTEPDMTSFFPQELTVRAGGFTARFAVLVMDSDKVLTSISVGGSYKEDQDFYGVFDKTGLVITGHYSNGTTQPVTPYASIQGYDRSRRGPQEVIARVNGKTASIPNIRVRIPADMTVTMPYTARSSGWRTNYRRVYFKGETIEMPHARFRPEAAIGNGTVALKYDNGGILDSDTVSGYNPNTPGLQTATLHLDDKDIEFKVAVVDLEPAVWFDYGYRRSPEDPTGRGPGTGKYYARTGETLVLSPVRFLVGYNRSYQDTGVSYSWSVSGGAFSSPPTGSGEFFSFTPTAAGTIYTVTVQVTGNSYITGQSITKTATTQVECFTEVPGQNTAPPFRILQPGVGQYAAGGSGFGWSLGAIGGYEVWGVAHQSTYRIRGNPMAAWAEPGVIWIQEDRNGNNVPDEMWYELKGSEDESARYRSWITRRYAITFIDPKGTDPIYQYGGLLQHLIYWADARGRADMFPSQWPVDGPDWMTFTTTLLRDAHQYHVITQVIEGGAGGLWGYVDVPDPTKHDGYDFDIFPINRAIRADGSPISLSTVRFIKVQTSVFGYGEVFGDFSTEIYEADYLGRQTDFPLPEDS